MFLHNSLLYKLRPDLSVNNENIEALCIEIINKKSKNIFINAQHRHPTSRDKKFEEYLKTFLSKTKNVNKPTSR